MEWGTLFRNFVFHHGGRKSEDGKGQRAEVRGRKAEDGGRGKTEVRSQMSEVRGRGKIEGRGRRSDPQITQITQIIKSNFI